VSTVTGTVDTRRFSVFFVVDSYSLQGRTSERSLLFVQNIYVTNFRRDDFRN